MGVSLEYATMFPPRLIRRPAPQAAVAWVLACWLAFLSTATVAPRMAAVGPDASALGAICTLASQGQGDEATAGGIFCPLCATVAGLGAALPGAAVPAMDKQAGVVACSNTVRVALPLHARPFVARGPPRFFV